MINNVSSKNVLYLNYLKNLYLNDKDSYKVGLINIINDEIDFQQQRLDVFVFEMLMINTIKK